MVSKSKGNRLLTKALPGSENPLLFSELISKNVSALEPASVRSEKVRSSPSASVAEITVSVQVTGKPLTGLQDRIEFAGEFSSNKNTYGTDENVLNRGIFCAIDNSRSESLLILSSFPNEGAIQTCHCGQHEKSGYFGHGRVPH